MHGQRPGHVSVTPWTAVPLAVAAARMGLKKDALRKRWKRGKISGYRSSSGRVYIYLERDGQSFGHSVSGRNYIDGLGRANFDALSKEQRAELDYLRAGYQQFEQRLLEVEKTLDLLKISLMKLIDLVDVKKRA